MSQTPRDPRQPFGARDPRAPFGASPQPAPLPEPYVRPPSKAPWVIAGLALLATLVIAAMVFLQPDHPVSTPSPTAPVATGPLPSASRVTPTTGTGVEWVHGSAKGYWRVYGESWNGNTVTLDVQVECTEGDLTWDFMSYPDDGNNALDADSSGREPYIATGHCNAGEKVRGYVSFTYDKRDGGSIILATSLSAISGLRIKG